MLQLWGGTFETAYTVRIRSKLVSVLSAKYSAKLGLGLQNISQVHCY